MMKIGYGKLGRSMPLTLDKCGNLGGDVEMVAVVKKLALRHPSDEFVLVGRNSGEPPSEVGLPRNVINPWTEWRETLRRKLAQTNIKGNLTVEQHKKVIKIFRELFGDMWRNLDNLVLWVGQHGSSNMPIPKIDDVNELTKPQDWCAFYAGYMLDGVNHFRDVDPMTREEVWLNADARNKHKMRDLKWPLRNPILTQYGFSNNIKHERYGDDRLPSAIWGNDEQTWNWGKIAVTEFQNPRVWHSTVRNVYSRLEVNGLAPDTPFGNLISFNDDFDRPGDFGMFINEARAIGVRPEMSRLHIMKEWVMPLDKRIAFLHGTWSSQRYFEKLGRAIHPAPWDQYYPKLHSVRCTFTTPSSGSGWATAKPWEAFAGGTVCFFHPAYDDQDNILGDAPAELRAWLRVQTPRDLQVRVDAVSRSRDTFHWLITQQREHFNNAIAEKRYLKMIEERIW